MSDHQPAHDHTAAFSALELRILTAKGLTDEQVGRLVEVGVASKADFATVGDAVTLRQLLPELGQEVADELIAWALGRAGASVPTSPSGSLIVESSDAVYCVHCTTRQPKDYSSGDLCIACGKQAEPIMSCHWCSSSGPGTFCRQCGAEFVPTAELDLAILLKREGLAKHEIPAQLRTMSAADKDVLWGRVRKSRG
jgi:hypothetical protein